MQRVISKTWAAQIPHNSPFFTDALHKVKKLLIRTAFSGRQDACTHRQRENGTHKRHSREHTRPLHPVSSPQFNYLSTSTHKAFHYKCTFPSQRLCVWGQQAAGSLRVLFAMPIKSLNVDWPVYHMGALHSLPSFLPLECEINNTFKNTVAL